MDGAGSGFLSKDGIVNVCAINIMCVPRIPKRDCRGVGAPTATTTARARTVLQELRLEMNAPCPSHLNFIYF